MPITDYWLLARVGQFTDADEFGFEQMALNRIEIWTSVANLRSLRLAERLGFTRDGSLRRRILEDDGHFYDCAVYGLLRDDWSRTRLSG